MKRSESHLGLDNPPVQIVMVGAAHGLATDDYTIPYVASWASSVPGRTPAEVVQSTAERVRGAAVTILDKLDTPKIGDGNPPGLDREPLAVDRAAAPVQTLAQNQVEVLGV
jgi:hypothetical protein